MSGETPNPFRTAVPFWGQTVKGGGSGGGVSSGGGGGSGGRGGGGGGGSEFVPKTGLRA